MLDKSIDDKLKKLNEEFKKLLSDPPSYSATTPEQFAHSYGLNLKQAKAWLKREPSYIPSDGISQQKPSDEDFKVPAHTINKGGIEKNHSFPPTNCA